MSNYSTITQESGDIKGNNPFNLSRTKIDPSFRYGETSKIPLETIAGYDAQGNLVMMDSDKNPFKQQGMSETTHTDMYTPYQAGHGGHHGQYGQYGQYGQREQNGHWHQGQWHQKHDGQWDMPFLQQHQSTLAELNKQKEREILEGRCN
jgi:hypothetical protein